MKSTLFVQNARPALQETLNFIDNQLIVENMTKTPTKKADTVNNIVDDSEKPTRINCWDCNGDHRSQTAQLTRRPSIAEGAGSLAMPLKLVEGEEDPRGVHPSQVGQQDHPLHQRHHLPNLKPRRKEERREKRRRRKDDRERKRNPNTTRGSALRPKPQHPPAEAGPNHVAKLVEHQNQEGKYGTL